MQFTMKLYKKLPIIIIFIILFLYTGITIFVLYSVNKKEVGEEMEVKNTLFNDYTEDNIKEVKTYAGGKYYTINDREDIRRFLEIIKSVTLTKYDSGYTFEGGFIFEIHLYDGTTTMFGVFSDKIMASTDDYTGYFKTDKNIADELLRLLSVWK